MRGVISIYSYFITEIISYHCEFRGREVFIMIHGYTIHILMSLCPVNLQKLQLQCPTHCVDKQRVAFHNPKKSWPFNFATNISRRNYLHRDEDIQSYIYCIYDAASICNLIGWSIACLPAQLAHSVKFSLPAGVTLWFSCLADSCFLPASSSQCTGHGTGFYLL